MMSHKKSRNFLIGFENANILKTILEKKPCSLKFSNVFLTKFHVQQIVKYSTDKINLKSEFHENYKTDNDLIFLLIFEFQIDLENLPMITNFQNHNIILIGIYENKIENILNQVYNFINLTEETQNELINNRMAIFEDKKALVKSSLNMKSMSFLNSEIFEKLIQNNLLIFRKNDFYDEELPEYYIQRKLKRFTQIDRKILQKDKHNNFIIVKNADEFEVKSREPLRKSIHYLKHSKKNKNLIWQQSKGPISDLCEYLINDDYYPLLIDEKQILNQKENILIISAGPGSGKSTILNRIIQIYKSEEVYFFKIILSTFKKPLKEIKENKAKLKDQDYILNSFLGNSSDFEITIFKRLALENKIVLMFDGVDEVIDYKEQVKTIIKTFSTNYKIKKILVTTRNILKIELENYFETIAFNLREFNLQDEINFLVKYWKSINMSLNQTGLKETAEELIQKLNLNLEENTSRLIGVPLRTKMIAFLYKFRQSKEDLCKISNITELYFEFVELKFHIKLGVNRYVDIKSNDFYEREKKKFYENHIQLSSVILLDENKIELNEEEIKDFGLILNFTNKIPIFLHQSFAEYFLAFGLMNKLKQSNADFNEIIKIITKSDGLVHTFLKDLILNDDVLSEKNQNQKENLEMCIRDKKEKCDYCETLVFLISYLIKDKIDDINRFKELLLLASEKGYLEIVELLIENGIDINRNVNENGQNALHLASFNGNIEIVRLLINKGININQKDHKNGQNALHLASIKGYLEIAKLLIEQGIEIKQKDKYDYNALHLGSLRGHKSIAELLIEKKIDINSTSNNCRNALHWASRMGHHEVVDLLISNGIDINQQDEDGDNALHWACKEGHKEIAELLIKKGIEINKKNDQGRSALHWASEKGHKEIIKLLIQKGIDINECDDQGKNALHWASEKERKIISEYSVEKGIDFMNFLNKIIFPF